jgi:hypothetical protein
MKSLAIIIVLLAACAPGKQETSETTDSTTVTENFDNVNEMTEAPAEESASEFDDEHGGVGGDQLRILSDATLFSEVGEGDETALSAKTFDPQLLERDAFQFLNGRPDYWYKIRLEDGKEGWVFGAYTDRQIPTDQRWDKLYNKFAELYKFTKIGEGDDVVATVDLSFTGRTHEDDDATFLLLFIATSGDNTVVNLVLTNSTGKQLTSRELKGVFKPKADGKVYEKGEKMLCFDFGDFKIENGNRVLDAHTECYQFEGDSLSDIY